MRDTAEEPQHTRTCTLERRLRLSPTWRLTRNCARAGLDLMGGASVQSESPLLPRILLWQFNSAPPADHVGQAFCRRIGGSTPDPHPSGRCSAGRSAARARIPDRCPQCPTVYGRGNVAEMFGRSVRLSPHPRRRNRPPQLTARTPRGFDGFVLPSSTNAPRKWATPVQRCRPRYEQRCSTGLFR